MVAGSALFAAESFQGCSELKLNETKSIVSCQHGDYEVTYETDGRKRASSGTVKIVKIGEPKQIAQYVNQNK